MSDKENETREIDYQVSIDVKKAFKDLKNKRTKRIIALTINSEDGEIQVEEVADRDTSVEEALTFFKENVCRFIIWDVDDKKSEAKPPKSNLFFFTWCPKLVRSVTVKPLYASNIKKVRPVVPGATEIYATSLEIVKEAIGYTENAGDQEVEVEDNWMDM